MIECKHYRELINKALDCELNDFEQVQLDEHLNSCDSCKSITMIYSMYKIN